MKPAKPRCVTNDGYLLWLAADYRVSTESKAERFCTDCTPEFQARAKAAGACSYPEIRFFRSLTDMGVYGALHPKGRYKALDSTTHLRLVDPEVTSSLPYNGDI